MSLLAKVRRRSGGDLWLFFEAFGRLLAAKAALRVVPFRRLAPRFGRSGVETARAPLPATDRVLARRVGWAVAAVARHVPLGFVCLPQAMAAQGMLRRRHMVTTLYLGVRADEKSGLGAHAWLRAGDFVLTGRSESRRHQALAAFGDGLPAETEALLSLLRTALGREEPPLRIGDSEALVRGAARHRVGAFLHCRLPDAARQALPEAVREGFERMARANALRALAHASELGRVAGIFQEEDLPFVNVKGGLLARTLYGDASARHAGDIDLLIDRDDLPRAEALLKAGGYRRTRPDFELTAGQTRHYSEKEFEYRGGPHETRIELTWRLEGLGGLRDLSAVEHEDLSGARIPIPSATENAIYLFQHGAKHGWRRLFWLLDVALLLEREGVDWPAVIHRARACGLERAMLEGAALAAELLATALPPAFHPRPGEQRIHARLLRNAREQIASPNADAGGLGDFLRDVSHRVLLQRRLGAKWRELAPHFHSARNWRDLRLPDALFWLYLPLAPWLWIRRRRVSRPK